MFCGEYGIVGRVVRFMVSLVIGGCVFMFVFGCCIWGWFGYYGVEVIGVSGVVEKVVLGEVVDEIKIEVGLGRMGG